MRVIICNAGYSGYTCACWRELSKRSGIELKIYSPPTKYPYSEKIITDLPIEVIKLDTNEEIKSFQSKVFAFKPDILVIPGWAISAFTQLLFTKELTKTKFLMAIDSDWRGTWRQRMARYSLYRILRKLSGIIVAGGRGKEFAMNLGISSNKIFTSTYGCDFHAFFNEGQLRSVDIIKSFVYVGRYTSVKGCDVLLKAYLSYSQEVNNPWPLDCYGHGDLYTSLYNILGEHVHGFVQPSELPATLAQYGVYILPSLHEPWGVSLVEAAASGMPLICSDAVSSGDDVVRHLYDGLVFPSGDVMGLKNCLLWMHNHVDQITVMGKRASIYARAYSPEMWTERWLWIFDHIIKI